MKLGERVRAAREQAGLNQEQLAKAIGMSQAGLSKLELSKTADRTKFASEICKATGVSLEWLIDGIGTSTQVKESPVIYGGINQKVLKKAIQLVELVIQSKGFTVGDDEKANIIAVIYEEMVERNDEELTDREIALMLKSVI